MTSQETPFALTIVKLFIVPIVIAITIWAGGFAAISTAILVIPIWTVLYTIASSEAMLKALDHLMLYRIRTREIEAQLTANLAQIHMQQAVSMARIQVEIGRQEIASRALIASHSSALDFQYPLADRWGLKLPHKHVWKLDEIALSVSSRGSVGIEAY
jgi:hypothetical protein